MGPTTPASSRPSDGPAQQSVDRTGQIEIDELALAASQGLLERFNAGVTSAPEQVQPTPAGVSIDHRSSSWRPEDGRLARRS
jgi:hypothetical protein